MDKIKSAAAALLLAAAMGCNGPSEYQWEMAQVDSLYQVVETYNVQLDSLNHDSLMATAQEVRETYAYLDENYPDSTDREFWLTDMNYLARVQKAFRRYEENQAEMRKQTDYTMHQLETLYNSLKDEKLKEDRAMTQKTAEDYLQSEAEAVTALRFKMDKIYPEIQDAMVIWDSLQPRFDSIEAHLRSQP